MNNKYSVACITLVCDKYTVRLHGAPCSSLDGVTACVVYTADSIRKFDSSAKKRFAGPQCQPTRMADKTHCCIHHPLQPIQNQVSQQQNLSLAPSNKSSNLLKFGCRFTFSQVAELFRNQSAIIDLSSVHLLENKANSGRFYAPPCIM